MITKPWSEKVWFSPCYVIKELIVEAAHGNKNLKRNREAWICAVAIICHSMVEPAEWWIQVPKNDPPDVLAMKFVQNDDGKGQDMMEVQFEVFEISGYDDESIEKSIERKLAGNDYSGMALIGFVRRKCVFDHQLVAEYIKKIKPNVLAIYLLVFEERNSTNTSFIQLFPQCL